MTEVSDKRVGEVMSHNIKKVDSMATVAQAIAIMDQEDVSSLVVDRRDENDEYGLLVIADIAREVVAKDRSAERVNVYEIMSKPVVALPVDMKLRYAIRLLARFEISRALVVNHRREPVGLVTLREMVLRHAPD